MEISGAYRLRGSDTGSVRTPDGTLTLTGGAEQIRSYTRTVSHTKEEGILIEDYYDGDLPAVLSLMTKNAWGGSACRILAEIQEEIHLKIR